MGSNSIHSARQSRREFAAASVLMLTVLAVSLGSVGMSASGKESSRMKVKEISLNIPQPEASKMGAYDWLKTPECSYISTPGNPYLPVKNIVVKLPLGSTVEDVKLTVQNVTLEGSYKITPSPKPRPLSSNDDFSEQTEPDPSIYQSENLYPEKWFNYRTANGLDDEAGKRVTYVLVYFYPLRYLPKQQTLTYAHNVSVTVAYEEPPVSSASTAQLDNLIITSALLEPQAVRLGEWKNQTGIRTRVLNIDWIYRNYPGIDRQEQIRNCIKDFLLNQGIRFATIFGDADQVPVRYAYVPDTEAGETTVPTDLYYADLDGTWDDNLDKLYADQRYDKVDGIPDVYVGRIPPSVLSNAQTAVDNIINYTKQFNPADSWARRIVLAAGTGNNGVSNTLGNASTVLKEYIAKNAGDKDIAKLYESSGNLSTTSMNTEINKGALFVNFAGHGNPNTWLFYWIIPLLGWYNGYGPTDVQSLTNGFKLPVVTTMACSTARFDDADCIGEYFVLEPHGGSIAYFGSTRIAWVYVGGSSPYGLMGEMDWRIYETFYEGSTKPGEMWGQSVKKYVQSHVSNYQYASMYDVKTFMEFVLLGDPTIGIGVKPAMKLSVEPASVTQTVGQVFRINVTISNVIDLYSYQTNLYYDRTILNGTVLELPANHFLKPQNPAKIFVADLSIVNDFNATHGRIQVAITLLGSEPGKTGNGTLFAVTFQAIANGMSSIEIEPVALVNSQGYTLIPDSIQNGTVSVESRHDTNIVFVLSPNPIDQGQLVTLVGNLTETGSGKPLTNTRVDAYVNETFADYFVTNSSGWFKWSDYVWVLGTYQVRVTYSGNASYNPSSHTETLIVQTPGKLGTQVAFTLSPNPASPGATVALSGALKDTANNPVYPAQVKVEYSTNVGATWNAFTNLNTNSAGQFSTSFTAPGVGTYLVRATYAGSATYGSSSNTQTFIVQTGGKVNTQIVFSFSPNPASPGQTVKLSGTLKTVTASPVYPAQVKVEYSTNGGASWIFGWNLNTNSAGAFSVSFGAPGKGSYLARVSYAGSASYNPSSSTQTLTVS